MSIALAHLSCRELVELVTAYLEGTLPAGARKRFEAHLAECDGCTTYLEQMRTTIRLSGASVGAGSLTSLIIRKRRASRETS